MWQILEHKNVAKTLEHAPAQVAEKYQIWKEIISVDGPSKLREFAGFHDEKLHGDREGQRSSRLNRLYRVIYMVEKDIVTVYVLEITPHRY